MKWMVLILVMVYTNNLLGQTVIIKDSLLDLPIENVTFHLILLVLQAFYMQ